MATLYLVGGYVRDKILGIESKDIDYAYVPENKNISVEEGFLEMESWMKAQGFEIFLSTPEMFTIRAKFPKGHANAGTVADFVMARKEVGYIEGTRRPILEVGSLEDDLVRRDFTLNALAIDESGNLIDLFEGEKDLRSKILRTPLDPQVTLMDDPLRILRALRFSITKNFEIHTSIWEAMSNPDILEKLRITVSAERIREEMMKMLKFNTTDTIFLLQETEKKIPGFTSLVFDRGLWLKPTFEHL